MKLLSTLLVILGFCLGTLGAAGYHSPSKSVSGQDPTDSEIMRRAEKMAEDSGAKTLDLPGGRDKLIEEAKAELSEENAAEREQPRESEALYFFVGGLLLLIFGGVLGKAAASKTKLDDSARADERKDLLRRMETVRDHLTRINAEAPGQPPEQVRKALGDLTEGEMYDLTSQFELWTRVLGFEDYARIWAGVANGERLTNRAWTLYTDGHPHEGRDEITLACEAFEGACVECR